MVHHGGRQLGMGCYRNRLHQQQKQTTSTTHDPNHHDYDNSNNNTRPTRPRRRRHATPPLSIKWQLNLHHTKATTSSALVQKAATRVSHDTLILSVTHLLPSTDARPFQAARYLSGAPCLILLFCVERTSFANLSVEFHAGCSAPLARTSQVGLVALSPGEALTTVAGPAAPGPHPLAHRCGDCWCVMTKFIARNITVLGALNSDVHAKLPFLWESSLADVLCRLSFLLCSARFQHVRMRPPVLGQLFFLHLFAVDSLDALNPRSSSVSKKNHFLCRGWLNE